MRITIAGAFRSGIWLFVGSSTSSILGYLYWLLVSGFVIPDVVGSAAAIISLQAILINLFSIGLPAGLQRYLGKNRGEGNEKILASYFWTALTFLILLNIPLSVAVFLLSSTAPQILGFTSVEIVFAAILILLGFSTNLFQSLFISILKTEITSFAQIISAVAKILVGVVLVISGFGFIGIMMGFVLSALIMDVLLVIFSTRVLRGSPYSFDVSLLKELGKASSAAWVPSFLASVGQSIGVLFVFGYVGGAETGFYYLALAIASIVNTLPASIQGMMYPYLSLREEGRNEATSQMIRISMAITAPLTIILFTYSLIPFMILGPAYQAASELLKILVLTTLMSPIVSGFVSHVYACGEYRHVAAIGSVMNVSRLFLYYFLVTVLYALGAAISYTLGMVFALLVVAVIGKAIEFPFDWSKYIAAIAIPFLCAIPIIILSVPFVIGIPLILIISGVAYGRLRLITKSDLRDLAPAFMSSETIAKANEMFNPIMKIVFGE